MRHAWLEDVVVAIVLVYVCSCESETQCSYPPDNWHFRGTNIALNMPTSQTPNSQQGFIEPATKAVDGNCDGDTDHHSCSHTDSNWNTAPTWTVELGQPHQITGVIIYNRENANGQDLRKRLAKFRVFCNYGKQGSVTLYDDGIQQNPKFRDTIIQIELDGTHSCSSISVQIPIYVSCTGYGCDYAYLTLCEVQVYAVGCGRPFITQGVLSPNKNWYTQHESFTVLCFPGYTMSSPTSTVTCCGQSYCAPIPSCRQVYCQVPEHPENGQYILPKNAINQTVPSGSKIHGECNIGYNQNIANTLRECRNDGTLSGEDLVCLPVTCQKPPGDINNGHYVYNNQTVFNGSSEVFNTTLFGECNKGSKIESQTRSIRCDQNGQWTGTKPICVLVTCQGPPEFSNGYYTPLNNLTNIYQYQSEISVICDEGYKLQTGTNTRKCDENGRWTGISPVCWQITCPWPKTLLNGYYTPTIEVVSNDDLPYNTSLNATCNDGYRMDNGSEYIRCEGDGKWSHLTAICTEIHESKAKATANLNGNDEESSLGMIIGVSVAAIVIVAVVVVAIIFVYRRRQGGVNQNKEFKYLSRPKKQTDGVYENQEEVVFNSPADGEYAEIRETTPAATNLGSSKSLSKNGNAEQEVHAYYSFQDKKSIPKSAIKIEHLSDIVLKGDKTRFEKEFEKLPNGMVEEHKEAAKAGNIEKNRYRNLFAYDHSRVVLDKDSEDQSDYINASYVNGYSKPRAYIASQGPMEDTLADFWKMIWQTNCSKIVMVTKLVEQFKTKCSQYWPDDGEIKYGDITVTLRSSESFSEFIIRTLSMKKGNSKTKHVTQFHFTAWPDKGVPKYASSLVQFRNKVKYAPAEGNGPIVVHCSAGIGRTGTFVALDYLTDEANDVGYVDVCGCVEAMRKQRVNFVQTLAQYSFLYHALVETLMLSTSALPCNQFQDWYNEMLQVDHIRRKRKLDIEFETLSMLSPTTEEHQYVSSKQIRNRKKNRYSNVLPVDEFIPKLEPLDGEDRDSTYINAVFLPSYKEKNAFIITQTPLEETKDDLWRLVWEHDVHIIVMMNNIHETSKAEQYWSDDSASIVSRDVTITHVKTETVNNHKIVSLSIQKYMITRSLVQIQCDGWKANRTIPDNTDDILSLLNIVQSRQRKSGSHPVLVHCMNGADKSGLFCVISAVIERMNIEQDVAISHVIEEMRNRREQIIPTVEQFEFVHRVVLAYIDRFSTYSNFSLI